MHTPCQKHSNKRLIILCLLKLNAYTDIVTLNIYKFFLLFHMLFLKQSGKTGTDLSGQTTEHMLQADRIVLHVYT